MARVICSAEVLRKTPLFARLHERHIAAILPYVEQRSSAARSIVLRAGETVPGLYAVLSGTLTVSQENEDGARFVETLLGPGEFFGELALIEGATSLSKVQAETECELLFVPRRELVQVLYDDPRVAFSMLNMALARLAAAHSALERLGLMSVSERVAHVVLHAVRSIDGELRVELAASRIGEMVGASREMISRVIGRMIRAGLLRRNGAALVVIDPTALALRSFSIQPPSCVDAAAESETFA